MARFRFQLEPLLTARRHVERRHQRTVSEIEAERRSIEERLRAHQHAITAGKHDQRGALTGAIDLTALRGHAATAMRGMRDAQRLAIELAGVYRRLEDARMVLTEAARSRRAVELLKERRFEEWKHEQDRLETAQLDELAVNSAARKERH